MDTVRRLRGEEVAAMLDARPTGAGKWQARCPAHDDRTPSLSITEGADARVLLKCFAGCDFERICAAARIDPRALRNGSRPASRPTKPAPHAPDLQKVVKTVRPLAGSPGERYLRSRGFDPARCIRTRFTPDLCGRPGIVWAVEDLTGRRVALHGRHTDGREPKCHTVGRLADGCTWWPNAPACRDAPELVIVEGPLDALACHLATGGPCSALAGTSPRPWLVEHLRGKRAVIGFDADGPGEMTAREWAQALRQAGAEVARLRPPDGCKDWAEVLEKRGPEWLRANMPEPEPIALDQADSWPEPLPLDELPEPTAFPVDALPPVLRDFVRGVAEHTQTPSDLPALVTISALSTACARTARIEGAPGWSEPLNVYSCVALPSGSRKSAVVAGCAEPIELVEEVECERRRPEVAARAAERATLEARLKARTQKAATASPADRLALEAERNEAARELAELPEQHLPRLLADDATPEVLARLMAEQSGRIGCLSAEGAVVLQQAAGRYSDTGSRLEVYLAAHAGDTLRVDRVGRKTDHVRSPALTLCLTVQPSVLAGAMARPDFRDRGLLARFLWSVPRPTIGYRRLSTPPVRGSVRTAYAEMLRRLLRRAPTDEPPVLRLSADAARPFLDFRERCERDLRPGERFEYMAAWGAKLPGLVLRIAGLLHLTDHDDAEPVSVGTIEAACQIGEYAAEHAKLAFAQMGADPEHAKAEHLLRWIRRNGEPEITARDVYHKNRAAFDRPTDVEPVLGMLLEYGHLRELPRTDGPGRPSRRFRVNPASLAQNTQNAQNPPPDPNIGHSGGFVQPNATDDLRSAIREHRERLLAAHCERCGALTAGYGLCDACDPFREDAE